MWAMQELEMIIDSSELPLYAHAVSFIRENDLERVKNKIEEIKQARFYLSLESVQEIKKKIKIEILSEDDQKLNEFRKKIFLIHTNHEELAFVFSYCLTELKVISGSNEQLNKYVNLFSDLEKAKDLLDNISKNPYNKSHYSTKLLRLISPYRQEMNELIKITQNITKVFSSEPDGESFENELGEDDEAFS